MKKQTKKILIYSIAIITILAISLVIIFFSGILQGMIQVCGNDCKPFYYSFNNVCYQSCGLNTADSDGTTSKVTNCDSPQTITDYFKQYMPSVTLYSDSQCTNLLSDYKCTPNWKCNGFTSCSKSKNGIQTRTCRDLNNCGTNENKPEESRACSNPIPPEIIKETKITSTTIKTDTSKLTYPNTKLIGTLKSIDYTLGRFYPPVPFDTSIDYKTTQPFIVLTEPYIVSIADYPLGYEMIALKIDINVVNKKCENFPVNIYWYDGDKYLATSSITVKPSWFGKLTKSCNFDRYIIASFGHTGQGSCPAGKQYIDYMGKNAKYSGYCIQLKEQSALPSLLWKNTNKPEIEHVGDYKVIIDTLGTIKEINYKVV